MRFPGLDKRALFVAGAIALCTGFAGPPRKEVALVFERIESLCAEEKFDEALAAGEQLLRLGWLDNWRRELELDGSWFLAPIFDALDPWLERFELGTSSVNRRAALHYARGVVLHRRDQAPGAAPAQASEEAAAATARGGFERALALAVAEDLRADASYNIGTLALLAGEGWRSQIPEIAGPSAAPGGPSMGVPLGAAAATPESPSPLEEARRAYLEARELLSVRLRLDWRDADTRANLELCLRRLKELEEIEEQREQSEQSEQSEEDQEQQNSEDSENSDDSQSKEESESEDANPEDEESPGEEQPEPDEPQEQPEPAEQDDSQEQEGGDGEPQPSEEFLTREEVQRLLDMLKEHEEEGEKMRAQARQAQRRKSTRDW